MRKKDFYRELLYVLGSHSLLDTKTNQFNEQYPLFGLIFDLHEFYGDKYHDYIPFSGRIPKEVLGAIKEDNIEVANNVIKTDPVSFLSFLIKLHDFYANLYHDGNHLSLRGKEKEIVHYALNQYLQNNEVNIQDMNELTRIINMAYYNLTKTNPTPLDEKIDAIIEELDDHKDMDYIECVDYKEISTEKILIRDYCGNSRFSLMSKYYIDSKRLDYFLMILNKMFFKGITFPDADRVIEIKRVAKEQSSGEYTKHDFNRGANTITIVYDQYLDGYKKIIYNLNTHEIIIRLVSPECDFKISKIITDSEKKVLLNFLESIVYQISNNITKRKSK